MNQVGLSRVRLSQVFWDIVLEWGAAKAVREREGLLAETDSLDTLQDGADYKTGSISVSACWSLYCLGYFFKPQTVVEVGTFIGKSTLSMIRGMEAARVQQASFYTCDFSNDIALPFGCSVSLQQFPRKSSTEMFETLVRDGVRCDLMLLDGRLQDADFGLLGNLIHQDTIFIIDDFDGIEKGVVNALALMQSFQRSHFLLYPPSPEALRRHGLVDTCTLALIIPMRSFVFTNQ